MLERKDVQIVSMPYRVLAGFFFLCSILVFPALVYFTVTEPLELGMLWLWIAVLVGGHVSGSIVFTGYAPFYLLSAHGPRKNI